MYVGCIACSFMPCRPAVIVRSCWQPFLLLEGVKCSCTNKSLGTTGPSATNSHMAAGKVWQLLCPSGFARDDVTSLFRQTLYYYLFSLFQLETGLVLVGTTVAQRAKYLVLGTAGWGSRSVWH